MFPHAALAEGHGLRFHMSNNILGSFERWEYLNDLVHIQRCDERPRYTRLENPKFWRRGIQVPEARPLYIFSQYGLLAPGSRKLEEDPNIWGGLYHYPLFAAAAGGHEDIVRCLVNSGADLQIVGPLGSLSRACGHTKIAP